MKLKYNINEYLKYKYNHIYNKYVNTNYRIITYFLLIKYYFLI